MRFLIRVCLVICIYGYSELLPGEIFGLKKDLPGCTQIGKTAQFDYEVEKLTETVIMRGNIKLGVDLYFPKDSGQKFPAILIRTNTNKNSAGVLPYIFASQGYIVAVQDVRGLFSSDGVWEPWVNEAEDGYDTIEWLAKLKQCNGKVGMMGGSYSATTQLLAAKLNPPHLCAIIPHNLPADPFKNSPYENGIFLLAPEMWWVSIMESNEKEILDPRFLQKSHKIKDDTNYFSLPVYDLDTKIIGKKVDYWRKWLIHNTYDEYWEKGSYEKELRKINCPTLLLTGWYDTHSIGTQIARSELVAGGNKNVKLIIGPWNHSNSVPAYPTIKNTGKEASIDILSEFLRWFDFFLKEIPNGINMEPVVKLFVMNNSKWIEAGEYPLANTKFIPLFFSSDKPANASSGNGKLGWGMPVGGRKFNEYNYNPSSPTPAFIYRNARGRKIADSLTMLRDDILVFETEPFDSALCIAGPVLAKLFASSSCSDTDWFINFYAVNEENKYLPLTHGCIRARYRNGIDKPELLEADKIYEYEISLWQTAIKIDKGWRLKAEIASADFPQYSRNLNTGGNNETGVDFKTARQKVYHSVEFPSRLIIPVIE